MIETWSKGPADDCMPEDIIVGTLAKVRQHPWWKARAKLALALLESNGVRPPSAVLDVGCGWAVNLDSLERAGYLATGMDISRRILDLIDHPRRRLIEADLNQPGHGTLDPQNGLLALDVIEHLDDDRGAVCRMAEFLRPGGLAIVSVPALPELFSEFDRIQGHRRRYLPKTLLTAFEGSGFKEPRIFWWGAWMVSILRRMRKDAKRTASPKTYEDYLRVPRWPLPLLMELIFAWEQNRALNGKLVTGTSLFALATRSNGSGN